MSDLHQQSRANAARAALSGKLPKLGDQRWLELAIALSSSQEASDLEPEERGWFEEVIRGRKTLAEKIKADFPNRADDLTLQFALGHVAAGLAFLNKIPQTGSGSRGLTSDEYLKSLVWSAAYLKEFLKKADLNGLEKYEKSADTSLPVVGGHPQQKSPTPAIEDWKRLKYFLTQVASTPSFYLLENTFEIYRVQFSRSTGL